jgi:hypothetical protein
VLHRADASPDRGGALHQRVLGRWARNAELESNLATGIGNDQPSHGVETEDRLGGREVELGQAEVGPPGVHADLHVVSGTRLLRCPFPHPQSDGYLNHTQTKTGDASSISRSRLEQEHSRTAPGTPHLCGRRERIITAAA